ncbi:MAG: alpha/beta hydrolase family protein [Vulcanimicrobiota bacterium]
MLRKILVISFISLLIFSEGFCENNHFPSLLTNDRAQKEDKKEEIFRKEVDSETICQPVNYSVGNQQVTGLLVYPNKPGITNFPGILFLQPSEENVLANKNHLKELAKKGYAVFCGPWKDHVDSVEAFDQLYRHPRTDPTAVGIMGIHDGGTEAIFLAIKKRREVKVLITMAGRPPYDLPGGDPASLIWAYTLVMHGENDLILPPSVSQFFYYNLLDKERVAQYVSIPFAEHYYNEADWQKITEEADRFLKQYIRYQPDEEEIKSFRDERAAPPKPIIYK